VTPFHHQPEAQHPKSSAIHKNAGRLPHLWANSEHALEKVPCAGEALACALIEAVLASHLAGLGGAERVKSYTNGSAF
jgi:hypothetical protein